LLQVRIEKPGLAPGFLLGPSSERFTVHGNAEPLYLFVSTQFRTENRFTLFLELL